MLVENADGQTSADPGLLRIIARPPEEDVVIADVNAEISTRRFASPVKEFLRGYLFESTHLNFRRNAARDTMPRLA